VAVQQPPHFAPRALDLRAIPADEPVCFRASDLALGVWKDTSVRHEVIHPDLVGNREFPAEIVES
jgi:hypothetical protein